MQSEERNKNEKLENLVVRIQNGDADAFNDFYYETQKYVRFVAYQKSGNSETTEDVVQEVYAAIYKNINTLENPAAAWGWVKSVAHNTAVNVCKKESKYILMSEEDSDSTFLNLEEDDTCVLPEDAMDNKETQRLIREMVDDLPGMQRLAILEYYFNQKKIDDIAKELGISSGTVKSYLNKGREKVREMCVELNKKTGVKLYTMPLAPVFYLVLRESLMDTAVTPVIPSAIAALAGETKAAETGAVAAEAKTAAAGTVKGTAAKAAVAKVIAGVAAVAVIGGGTAFYVKSHSEAPAPAPVEEVQAVEEVSEEVVELPTIDNSYMEGAVENPFEGAEETNWRMEERVPVEEADREWVQSLYDALQANDFDTVKTALQEPEAFVAKCATYELQGWAMWDYENAYRLVLSDTETVGVVVYWSKEDSSKVSGLSIFTATADGQDGFEYSGYGDKEVDLQVNGDGTPIWTTFDGAVIDVPFGEDMPIEEGGVYGVWHV